MSMSNNTLFGLIMHLDEYAQLLFECHCNAKRHLVQNVDRNAGKTRQPAPQSFSSLNLCYGTIRL